MRRHLDFINDKRIKHHKRVSHTFETDAAAAKRADKAGKIVMDIISSIVPVVPYRPVNDSINGNSTTAAVAAAHKLDSADVKGSIAAERAP
jgi:hypothetical protein